MLALMKSIAISLLSVIFIGACSNDELENRHMPISVEDLASQDVSDDERAANLRWTNLATALGISLDDIASRHELEQRGQRRSNLLSKASRSDYTEIVDRVRSDWKQTAYRTQCAEVESVIEFGPAEYLNGEGNVVNVDGATVFEMKYRLQANADGLPEDKLRSGLIVLPDKGSLRHPILLYAHGGTAGLAYRDIMRSVGQLQSDHVVVAPTFPGEPLCRTALNAARDGCDEDGIASNAVGEKDIYDGDSDELLGIYSCVVRVRSDNLDGGADVKVVRSAASSNSQNFSTVLQLAVPVIGSGLLDTLPKSLIVGESRGGLTALIALAKSGVQYEFAVNLWTSTFGKKFFAPGLFNCGAFISSPVGLTSGRFQIGLESAVKGRFEGSVLSRVPGMSDLDQLIEPYRTDPTIGNLNETTTAIVKRDPMILSPFVAMALRNWSTIKFQSNLGEKSAALFLHGAADEVVPFDQTRFALNNFVALSDAADFQELSKSKGIYVTARAFRPEEGDEDGDSHDNDDFYFRANSFVPESMISEDISNQEFADGLMEDMAIEQAEAVFSTKSPNDEQMIAARNYVGSGVITEFSRLLSRDGKVKETQADGKTELRPVEVLRGWRDDSRYGCQKAMNRNPDD